MWREVTCSGRRVSLLLVERCLNWGILGGGRIKEKYAENFIVCTIKFDKHWRNAKMCARLIVGLAWVFLCLMVGSRYNLKLLAI